MNLDRWKKLLVLAPLAPYLALLAVLLLAGLAVTYYRWRSEIRRAAQAELLNQQERAEIAALRAGAAREERRAIEAEGRAQELGEELEKLSGISHQLSAKLEKAKTDAAAEKARLAVLPAEQLAPELQKTVPTPGILRFAQDDSEGARRVLEIITDRDACHDQSAIKDLRYANCRESLVDYAAVGEQQALQIRDLKQALDLEKRAFDKRDDLGKKEVKAAKGSWFSRFTGKAKWFVIGVGAGAVAGALVAR